jgi:hypothetical protein
VPIIATVGNTTNESSSTSTEKMDLATELHNSIASVMVRRPMKNSAVQLPLIQTEFKFFEKSGTRSPNLDKLFLALETIQPTSTCNERIFSVAGGFSTKIRNQMLNSLVFLKYCFLEH